MTTPENLYYGNIAPHEYEVERGSEYDVKKISGELYDIQNYSETIKKRKAEMKQTVDLIEQIVKEGQNNYL